MSFNQVVRSVGFAVGSALSAFILSAYTPHGRAFPEAGGYGTAAWAGVAVMAVTLTVIGGLACTARSAAACGWCTISRTGRWSTPSMTTRWRCRWCCWPPWRG